MFETLTIPLTGKEFDSSGRGSVWATLEQEYKESVNDAADLGDLYQMLALAFAGRSSFEYVANECPWVKIDGDIIIVSLDFYVWPSSLELPYGLDTDLGTISLPEIVEEHRSFDVPFDNSDSADLPYVFDGTLTPEMPFIASDGELLPTPEISVADSVVTLSEPATCVLRAEGKVQGYKHTIEMRFIKAVDVDGEEPGEGEEQETVKVYSKVENLQNTIILSWVDENGKTDTDTLDLAIPECVAELLAECPDGGVIGVIGCLGRDCSDKDPFYLVYYSTCNGKDILKEGWEQNE